MTCILVVEGESDIRETLVEALRDAGFEVVEANSADAAIQLLGMEELRLIVTDVNLPGRLDGIDLAFAARETNPGIPVVFISGRPAMLEDAHALGQPAAFLQKPFSFKMLVGDIRRLSDAPR